MEETKRRVRKATLIIVGTLIVFAAFTVWVSDTPAHFDESNTYVYEGTLSRVDCRTVRKLRWGTTVFYTLRFDDGQEFKLDSGSEAHLLDKQKRYDLEILPAGKKVTVIAYQESNLICAFWTDERTFISLDDFNAYARKNKLYLFITDAFLALIFVPMAVFYDFDAFRQLRISRGKQRRKAKRKQLRSELKDAKKDKRQQ